MTRRSGVARSSSSKPCPCKSGAPYRDCCKPFHDGREAPDPERLMRSRFSAFALGHGAYLWRTLHPDNPLRQQAEQEVVPELGRARQTMRYQGLTVHDVEVDGARGRVLFTARVFEKGRDRSFVELSEFERIDGAWRYLEGVLVGTDVADTTSVTAFLAALAE